MLILTLNCGTTIFCIATEDVIVMGADGLARHDDGQTETFDKLAIIQQTVAVGFEGMGMIYSQTGETRYRVDKWMSEMESSLCGNTDAGAVASAIEAMHPFIHLIRIDEIERRFYRSQVDERKSYLADFLVASASTVRMQILRVRVRMAISLGDPRWRIEFERTACLDGRAPVNPFVCHGAGKIAEIEEAFSGNGEAYKYMVSRTNGSFPRLLDGKAVGLDELQDVVRCAISLEARIHPKQVGPPFVVATLQAGKPVSVTSYKE